MYFNLQVTKISGFAPPPRPTPCLLNTSEYCKKCDATPLWPPQQPPVSRSPPCPPSCPPSHTRPAPPPLPLLKSTRSTTRPLLRAEMILSLLHSCWTAASLLLNFQSRVHLLAHHPAPAPPSPLQCIAQQMVLHPPCCSPPPPSTPPHPPPRPDFIKLVWNKHFKVDG